jgi:outer membrane protein OmpA-like peptidoglycan-associated protein
LSRTIIAASSALLLVSTACSANQLAHQSAPTAVAPVAGEQSDQQQPAATPAPKPEVVDQTVPAPNNPAAAQLGSGQGESASGQSPAAQESVNPAAYVPKTEHDNTPWRFNMQQDGKGMSAEAFEAWMKQRGVRVATGKPAMPLVQNCPTPEGDKSDGDGDRIINCLDKCPDSVAGQTIGPDGCPVPVSIDLQGVTFAYDRATLESEAKAVLDEAVKILLRHPALKVEVAGHTDSRGDAKYNQLLSERRAKAVYDYLAQNGVDEARLIGPLGFGETRPLVPNQKPDGSDDPAARAKNRRTELNIQN